MMFLTFDELVKNLKVDEQKRSETESPNSETESSKSSTDEASSGMQTTIKRLFVVGAKLPKPLMLYIKKMIFFDRAISDPPKNLSPTLERLTIRAERLLI